MKRIESGELKIEKELRVKPGDVIDLGLKFDDGKEHIVRYYSLDESIAMVDKDGKVTIVGTGETYVVIVEIGPDGEVIEHVIKITSEELSGYDIDGDGIPDIFSDGDLFIRDVQEIPNDDPDLKEFSVTLSGFVGESLYLTSGDYELTVLTPDILSIP